MEHLQNDLASKTCPSYTTPNDYSAFDCFAFQVIVALCDEASKGSGRSQTLQKARHRLPNAPQQKQKDLASGTSGIDRDRWLTSFELLSTSDASVADTAEAPATLRERHYGRHAPTAPR